MMITENLNTTVSQRWQDIVMQCLQQKHNYLITKKAKREGMPSSCRKRYYLGKKFPNVYLTPREIECLCRLIDDKLYKSVAKYLGISARTVEAHVFNVKKKMGLSSIKRQEFIVVIMQTEFANFHCQYSHSKQNGFNS